MICLKETRSILKYLQQKQFRYDSNSFKAMKAYKIEYETYFSEALSNF